MPQALIKINGVVGSNTDLPIATLVQLDNQNAGGELTFLWTIVDQPPGPPDVLSSAVIQNPTFTPNKEGTYLIELVVNAGPGQFVNRVVAAVRQFKTRTRIPATSETNEADPLEGWSTAAEEFQRLTDDIRARPGFFVGVNGSGGALQRGDIVRATGFGTIKTGLPGEERVPTFTKAVASNLDHATDTLFLVMNGVDGNLSPPNGSLISVMLFGSVDELSDPANAAVVGMVVYLSDASIPVITTPSKYRPIGRVIRVPAVGQMSIWFDGALHPINQNMRTMVIEDEIILASTSAGDQNIFRDVTGTGGLAIGTEGPARLNFFTDGNFRWTVDGSTDALVGRGTAPEVRPEQAVQPAAATPLIVRGGQGAPGTGIAVGGAGALLELFGGDAGANGGAGGGNGGSVQIDSGTKTSATEGSVTIGTTRAASVTIGRTAGTVVVNGPTTFNESVVVASGKQLSVGTGAPSASAIVQADSTSRGFLVPRMTKAQRDAIASPATGLEIFNTDTNEKNIYDGTTWQQKPYRQSTFTRISANTTTTSVTFVNLLTSSITIKDGGILLIQAAVSASNTNAGKQVFFRIRVDNVLQDAADAVCPAPNLPSTISIMCRVTGLSVGAHTVDLDWRVDANTGQVRPVAAPDAEGAQLRVQEVTV